MTDYDVIVIGSGAGGLTAAVALARAGRRVLDGRTWDEMPVNVNLARL